MKVAIVGAGIAGLATAKVLKSDGFDISVFERDSELGGVWASHRTYPEVCADTPKEAYAFPDFPHAATTSEFPTASEMRAYLAAYVAYFNLRPFIALSTEVVEIARSREKVGQRHFRLSWRRLTGDDSVVSEDFDFVVICNGVFSSPYKPAFAHEDAFSGHIVHSSQMPALSELRNARVVVVGGGKSAYDCAASAADVAASCHLVVRDPHWMLPRYLGAIRFDRVMLTRAHEMVLPPWYEMTRSEALLRRCTLPLSPLRCAWWALLEALVRRATGMPHQLQPGRALRRDIERVGVGSGLYDRVRSGRITVHKREIAEVGRDRSLTLTGGQTLPADWLVCATGWRQVVPFLSPELRVAVADSRRFRLYRHILPANEPRMGFIGYAASVSMPVTAEVSAHWLAQWFRGDLGLPSSTEMEASIDRALAWAQEKLPKRDEGYFIGAHIFHYVDTLLRDMRVPQRRCRHWVGEWFGPLYAGRYAGIASQRGRGCKTGASP